MFQKKIKESEQAITQLEEMKEISEELEETQTYEIKQLRSQVNEKETQILDLLSKSENLDKKLKDQQKTIDQFRNVVKTQQQDLSVLRKKEQESQMETSQLESQTHTLKSQNLQLFSQLVKKSSLTLAQNLAKFEAEQKEALAGFIHDVVPELVLEKDFSCFRLTLTLKRFSFKIHLIINYLDQFQFDFDSIFSHFSELTFYAQVSAVHFGSLFRLLFQTNRLLGQRNLDFY